VHWPSFTEQWLSESFAEICAGLFMHTVKGEGAFRTMEARWVTDAAEGNAYASMPMANRLHHRDALVANRARKQLLYDKGAALLDTLRQELGDQQFMLFLRAYQRNFVWKDGSTQHVVGLLDFITKRKYGPFFETCYWGNELPGKK